MESLKYIIDNYNNEENFQLFQKTLTVSAGRNVVVHLRNKYLSLAYVAKNKYCQIDNNFNSLKTLVEKSESSFISIIKEVMQEVVNDALSIGLYTLDVNTIYSECRSTYFKSFYNAYNSFLEPYNHFLNYRRTVNRAEQDIIHTSLDGALYSNVSNIHSINNAARDVNTLFKNQQMRENLKNSVFVCSLNLFAYIIDQFPQKHDISFCDYVTNDDIKKGIGIFNNLSNPSLNDEQKKEMIFSILNSYPFEDDYYYTFSKMFPDNATELSKIANYFNANKRIVNALNENIIEFTKKNLGSTENDANNCRILLDKKVAEYGLKKENFPLAYKIIDDRCTQLDIQYRTVEGIVLKTRQDADTLRNSIVKNKDILQKDPRDFIYRVEHIRNLDKIKALSLPPQLIDVFVKRYSKFLSEFDKKCKNAMLYQQTLDGEKKSVINMISSVTVSSNQKMNDWNEITHNGKYDIYSIMNRASVPDRVDSTESTPHTSATSNNTNNIDKPSQNTIGLKADDSKNDTTKDLDKDENGSSKNPDVVKEKTDVESNTSEMSNDNGSASFDELYEKAMNTADSKENYDGNTSSETDAEKGYNKGNGNEAKPPVTKSSVNPPPVPTITQKPAPSQYYYSEKKKTPVVYVLVGVIAVLLVGMGILGGILLTKNKDNKGSNNSSIVTAESKTDSTTEMIVTSDTESRITTTVSTKEEPTAPAKTGHEIKFYPSEKVKDYPAYLEKLRDMQNNGTYRDQNNGFFLCDINEDDTPELFVTFNTEEPDLLFAGSVYSGELVPFAEFMGAGMLRGITLFDNGAIGITSGGNEGHGISYKYYSGGNSFSDNNDESINYIYENGSLSYISYQNGTQEKHISETEAEQIQKKYIEASYTSVPVSSVIISEPEKPSSKYSDSELGFMYNLFYIRTYTWGDIAGGYIIDYDGDGTDEFISSGQGTLNIIKFQNGGLENIGQPSQNISSSYYGREELKNIFLELSSKYGYGVNSDFVSNSEPGIGYVATSDMFSTLNLRSAPSTDSEVITQLPNGLMFNTSENPYDKPAFCYITTTYKGQSYSGYVSSDYVRLMEKGL